jgi:hypothetical protein
MFLTFIVTKSGEKHYFCNDFFPKFYGMKIGCLIINQINIKKMKTKLLNLTVLLLILAGVATTCHIDPLEEHIDPPGEQTDPPGEEEPIIIIIGKTWVLI